MRTIQNYYDAQVEKARNHIVFRHYTTLDSLPFILKSEKLRLSALSIINDPIEEERTDKILKNKFFVTCFSHEVNESIPMWRMYGRDTRGVCIELPSLEFAAMNNVFSFPYPKNEYMWEFRHAAVVDVIYRNNLNDFTYDFDPCDMGKPIQAPQCSGYAKTSLWQYENETRIIVRVDVTPNNPSRRFSGETEDLDDDKTYSYPEFRFIYMDISEQIHNGLVLRMNPFMTEEQFQVHQWEINRMHTLLTPDRVMKSQLSGAIVLR
jgi:hypothetical protein